MTVLEFRIERHDSGGNRMAPVPVQMRGSLFTGTVNNGDEISVDDGTWQHGTLTAKSLKNLTTGADVRVKVNGLPTGCSIVVLLILLVGFAFLGVVFVNSVILGNHDFP
jgi:hypothetical protein